MKSLIYRIGAVIIAIMALISGSDVELLNAWLVMIAAEICDLSEEIKRYEKGKDDE